MMLTILKYNKDAKDVLGFCHKNRAFFINYENTDPNAQVVKKLFSQAPNGVNLQQKLIYGFYQSGKLCALIELIKDRHQKHEWLLSLFMVDIDKRQQGLGKKIITDLELYLSELGVTCLLLGVIEDNIQAMSFWKSLNYTQHTHKPVSQEVGGKLQNIHTFYKEI